MNIQYHVVHKKRINGQYERNAFRERENLKKKKKRMAMV